MEQVPDLVLRGGVDALAGLEPVGADMGRLLERRDEGPGRGLGNAGIVDGDGGLRLLRSSSRAPRIA
jgi:hypothetical protein